MSFNGIWEPTKLLQCAHPITNSPTWYFLIWQFVFHLSFSSSRVRATRSFVDFVLWVVIMLEGDIFFHFQLLIICLQMPLPCYTFFGLVSCLMSCCAKHIYYHFKCPKSCPKISSLFRFQFVVSWKGLQSSHPTL